MSALVLGKRSSSCFFEELHHHPAAGAATTPPPPPSGSKRARFGASPLPLSPSPYSASSLGPSTLEFSPLPASAGASSVSSKSRATSLGHLRSLFPHIDEHVLERALEASSNDLDSAINSLNQLCRESSKGNLQTAENIHVEDIGAIAQPLAEGVFNSAKGIRVSQNPSTMNNFPADGCEWVELFVREMMGATGIADARSRASEVLQVFEKSVIDRVSAQVAQTFCKDNMMLKDQIEGLLRDNSILKRAVAIQHERQIEFDERNLELQHLKQLAAQYQEQLRALEVNNYALSMHLRQAQQSSSIPGRFHPDVF